jgi:hypothetical protein
MSAKNLLFFLIVILLAACTNTDSERKKVLLPDSIYRVYNISGEEGRDWVTGYFQFRRNGPNGMPIMLREPQKISLDGQILTADSTVEKEFFYEIQTPREGFAGEHAIVFTDINEEEHTDKFDFVPFRLTEELAEVISRDDLVLQFEGLEDGEKLRVVMVDTAFASKGVNEFYVIEDGKLDLSGQLKGKIQNGPVTMQLFKETESHLTSDPRKGQIAITYGLKREFELKD